VLWLVDKGRGVVAERSLAAGCLVYQAMPWAQVRGCGESPATRRNFQM
jgi:hypothetical protein